ncbi:hypothetical protein ABZ942_16915 [Nocardia sp. NPDC046473]
MLGIPASTGIESRLRVEQHHPIPGQTPDTEERRDATVHLSGTAAPRRTE